MKISEIVEKLEKIKEEYGDLDLVYSVDDEGNAYHKVYYTATPGYWDNEYGEWINKEDEEYWEERGKKVNSVCVN